MHALGLKNVSGSAPSAVMGAVSKLPPGTTFPRRELQRANRVEFGKTKYTIELPLEVDDGEAPTDIIGRNCAGCVYW